MTNEEIVLNKFNNNHLGKSLIKFAISDRNDYWYQAGYDEHKRKFDSDIKELENIKGIKDRVLKIIKMHYKTIYANNNRFQCHSGARRSTGDIWRIYRYYFGDIDIFSIMRALYYLVNRYEYISTYRCPNVQKRVFWFGYETKNMKLKGELGVPFSEWKDIGLREK